MHKLTSQILSAASLMPTFCPAKTWLKSLSRRPIQNHDKRSIERDQQVLDVLDPFIGSLPLQRVHHDTLARYFRARLEQGLSPGTVNRDLAVVRRILNRRTPVKR